MEPPAFQEASRCVVCNCSFTPFRRRHHCRCCGRTLCAEHSSHQMALPQFSLQSPVRVCAACFNDSSSSLKKDDEPAVSNRISIISDSVSRLDINSSVEAETEPTVKQPSMQGVLECKCGMPLCICKAPAEPEESVTIQSNSTSNIPVRSNPKPKKTETVSRNRGSTSNTKHGTIFNPGQTGDMEVQYEASGEGLREAIKNGDFPAARNLLNRGVDANYCDRQGSSLLHLAAVFNQTEIAFALMDHGASLDCKNPQGETPLDCAPATLQYKMKKKMEESEQLGSIPVS